MSAGRRIDGKSPRQRGRAPRQRGRNPRAYGGSLREIGESPRQLEPQTVLPLVIDGKPYRPRKKFSSYIRWKTGEKVTPGLTAWANRLLREAARPPEKPAWVALEEKQAEDAARIDFFDGKDKDARGAALLEMVADARKRIAAA